MPINGISLIHFPYFSLERKQDGLSKQEQATTHRQDNAMIRHSHFTVELISTFITSKNKYKLVEKGTNGTNSDPSANKSSPFRYLTLQ